MPDQFTVREQEKKYVTYREILYTAPGKKYNVNNDNPIVMNYTSEQHEYPDTIIGDPVDKIYETGSDTSWSCELVETNIEPEPSPTSPLYNTRPSFKGSKLYITHPVLTLSISHDDNNNIINKIKYFIITSQYH